MDRSQQPYPWNPRRQRSHVAGELARSIEKSPGALAYGRLILPGSICLFSQTSPATVPEMFIRHLRGASPR